MKQLVRLLAKLSPRAAEDGPKLRNRRKLGKVTAWLLSSRRNAVVGVGSAAGVLLLTAMFVLTRTVYSFQVDQYDRSVAAAAVPTATGVVPGAGFDPGFVPEPTPSSSALPVDDPALQPVARSFLAAWAAGRTSTNANAWVTTLTPYTTPELLSLLRYTAPGNIPTVKVASMKSIVTDGAGHVYATVAQGVLKVDLKQVGGKWLVDGVAPVAPGDYSMP